MTTIIAGRFEQQDQVQQAIAEMVRAGFPEDHISSFYLNPPGRHHQLPMGGDHNKSSGAEESPQGSAAGAVTGSAVGAAVGAVTTPLSGPLGAVTGAFVGGYVGSLAGSLGKMKDDGGAESAESEPLIRHSGMMVAVSVSPDDDTERAAQVLRACGAVDIERANGTIVNGDWEDFDPESMPNLLEGERLAERATSGGVVPPAH